MSAEAPPPNTKGPRRGSLKAMKELHDMQAALALANAQPSCKAASHLSRFLLNHTVADLGIPVGGVVEIDSSETPEAAFAKLFQNKILGAPVWDEESKTYIGELDLRDCVSQVLATHLPEDPAHRFDEKMVRSPNAAGQVASSVTYLARRNPLVALRQDSNLKQVAEILSGKAHRVPVVDENTGRCIAIISQSKLIEYIQHHKAELGAGALDETIEQANVGLKQVVCVPSNTTALEAFKTLDSARLSGIGIIDEDNNGQLIGNTSARDIKEFVETKGSTSMDMPILDYLAKIRQKDHGETRAPICTVHDDATLEKVLGTLAKTKYHRVFVINKNRQPVGVISISDFVRIACGKPPKNRRVSAASMQSEEMNQAAAMAAALKEYQARQAALAAAGGNEEKA